MIIQLKKIHSDGEIVEKLGNFMKQDQMHGISRGDCGNVTEPQELIGKQCHYVDKIRGRRHMVAPIDSELCATVNKGKFSGIYNIELFNLLYNVSVSGLTYNGYHEIKIYRDVVLALDGIIPNICELYMPIFLEEDDRIGVNPDILRRTYFHVDAYRLMTGDLRPMKGYVIHHELTERIYRTYNVYDNMGRMTKSRHATLHMLEYHKNKRNKRNSTETG